MVELAKKMGGVTMVGYMKRFSMFFRKAKELLESTSLGTPLSFKAYAYSSDFQGLTKESKSSVSRGGALKDIGCHIIDLSLWLLGDLKLDSVISCYKIGGSETSVSFAASNSSGLKGQFDISQRMPNYRLPEFGCNIELTKGKLDVNDDRVYLTLPDGSHRTWFRHDLQDNVNFWLGETEYYRENQKFVESIIQGRQCEPNFETSVKVDSLIDQVKEGVKKYE